MPKPTVPSVAPDDKKVSRVEDMVMSLVNNILDGCDVRLLTQGRTHGEDTLYGKARHLSGEGSSIEQVAKRLGITKVTVYSYLDELRKKEQTAGC